MQIISFLVGWVAVAAASTGAPLMFAPSSELTYSYHAHVSTGVMLPNNEQSHASHFSISGKLRIRTDETSQRVLFKLDDIKYSAYNGPTTRGKIPLIDYKMIDLLEENSTFRLPFAATYDNGKVQQAEFLLDEPLYSRNFKKSVISQFQLDLAKIFSNISSFHSNERGVTGKCHIMNSVTRDGFPRISLRKFWDSFKCDEQPFIRTDNDMSNSLPPPKLCRGQVKPISSGTERRYSMEHTSGNVLRIQKIHSRAGTSIQPFGIATEAHFQIVNQTLELISVSAKSEDPAADVWTLGDTAATSLVFAFPQLAPASGTDPDMTFEKIPSDYPNLVNQTLSLLETMTSRLNTAPFEEASSEQLNMQHVHHILGSLRRMDAKSLQQVTEHVLVGTSYQTETMRSLVFNLLAKVGTLAAVQVVIPLITQNIVTPLESNTMLMDLPFHIRYLSERFVQECQPLLNMNKKESTLAFASILGKICSYPKICSPALVDEYIKLFYGKLRDTSHYWEQVVYMQALNNIRLGPVNEYLEPIVKGEIFFMHQLRMQAAAIVIDSHLHEPKKLDEIYWPMLMNTSEHIEMRHFATKVLLYSYPMSDHILNLLWYIRGQSNAHLYNMFYTTVQSLLDLKNPFTEHLRGAVRAIAHLIPKPQHPVYTYNYIVDYDDDESGTGMIFQYTLIANEDSGLPNIENYEITPYYVGQDSNAISVLLRIEGETVNTLFKSPRTFIKSAKSEALYLISSILHRLGVNPRKPEPRHIEIIVKKQRRTVEHYYSNETNEDIFGLANLDAIVHSLTLEEKERGFHTNGRFLSFDTSMESVHASDLGLPVTISLQRPQLVSLRANFSFTMLLVPQQFSIQLGAWFDLRYWSQQSYGLYTMHPITGHFHGVWRATSMNAHFPVNTSLVIEPLQNSVKFRYDWLPERALFSVIRKVRTQTWVHGHGAKAVLPRSCPSCSNMQIVPSQRRAQNVSSFTSVKNFDRELELRVDLISCERPEEMEYMKRIPQISYANIDTRSLSVVRMLMEFVQMRERLERTPGSGSCTIVTRGMPVGLATSVELAVKVEMVQDKRCRIHGLLTYRRATGLAFKSWNVDLIMAYSYKQNHTDDLNVKLYVNSQVEGEPEFKICAKLDAKYPKTLGVFDFVPWPLLYENHWKKHRTEYQLSIGVGTVNAKCPESQLNAVLVSAPRNRQIYEPPTLGECEREKGETSTIYPATESCRKAASSIVLNRHLSLSVKLVNLPLALNLTLLPTLRQMLPCDECLATSSSFAMNIMSYEDGYVSVSMGDANEPENIEYKPNIAHFLTKISSLSYVGELAKILGYLTTCRASGGSVITFDQSSPLRFTARNDTWTLLTGDCVDEPIFAVFIKAVAASDLLAVRVHLRDDVVEMTPVVNSKSWIEVILNGERLESNSAHNTTTNVLWDNNGDVYARDRLLHVVIRTSHNGVTIIAPRGLVAGQTCGLCGDCNTILENKYNFLGPAGHPVPLEDVFRLYSLQDL